MPGLIQVSRNFSVSPASLLLLRIPSICSGFLIMIPTLQNYYDFFPVTLILNRITYISDKKPNFAPLF